MQDDELKALFETAAAQTAAAIAETRRLIAESAAETQQQIAALRGETQQQFAAARAENQQQLDAATAEMRLHFDITAEGLRHEIGLIAEKVIRVDEKLTSEAADIRAEMRRGFADMESMFRFSHNELDRRIRALEH
jgi:acetyl-CoA acetyltransferase